MKPQLVRIQQPFVNTDGLDSVEIALANYWVDGYNRNVDLLLRLDKHKHGNGKKWCEGMQRHYVGVLADMLEEIPAGVYLE
jgi:hypothetical protein